MDKYTVKHTSMKTYNGKIDIKLLYAIFIMALIGICSSCTPKTFSFDELVGEYVYDNGMDYRPSYNSEKSFIYLDLRSDSTCKYEMTFGRVSNIGEGNWESAVRVRGDDKGKTMILVHFKPKSISSFDSDWNGVAYLYGNMTFKVINRNRIKFDNWIFKRVDK